MATKSRRPRFNAKPKAANIEVSRPKPQWLDASAQRAAVELAQLLTTGTDAAHGTDANGFALSCFKLVLDDTASYHAYCLKVDDLAKKVIRGYHR